MRTHHYSLDLSWDEPGTGTTDYRSYCRRYRITGPGKPTLIGSADPAFLGDPGLYNPEELLLGALASCHMLSYLALCTRRGVTVRDYVDSPHGTMQEAPNGSGRFEEVVLEPRVCVASKAEVEEALRLHDEAHATCFIARSCSFPVLHRAKVTAGAPRPPPPVRVDMAVRLPHRPGTLAALGEALGAAGISIEGGGGFVGGEACEVHFLVEDGERAAAAVREAGLEVLALRETVAQRLDQGRPGQLGRLARAMAEAGVNLEVVYSDHENRLIVCADDPDAARRVAAAWRAR
jgi:organic hydroperoxide reductase OsmC/OhrA